MKAFDAHCHLYDESFDKDRDKVISDAKKVLWGILVVGEDPKSNRKIAELEKQYKGFWYSGYGIHPEFADKIEEDILEEELKWIKCQKPICIGEIGLDKFLIKTGRQKPEAWNAQIKLFQTLLSLAKELDLPVNVHSRWASKEVLELLFEEKVEKVLLHAFPGTLTEAQKAMARGYYISIGTSIFYSKQKQDLARHLKMENIILETDSPVLAPVRGQRNVPANIALVAEELARIKGVPKEKVIDRTNQNAKELFSI